MEGLRHVHNTVLRHTRSPSHPDGSIMAGGRGCPRGVAPLQHHSGMRDHPGGAYGRGNDVIAPAFLVLRCPDGSPLCAASRWLLHTG